MYSMLGGIRASGRPDEGQWSSLRLRIEECAQLAVRDIGVDWL